MARPEKTDKAIKDLAERLMKELNAPKSVSRPPESITALEYSKHSGCRLRAARDFLAECVREGKAKRTRIGNQSYFTFQ